MASGGKEEENRGNIPHNRHRAGMDAGTKDKEKNKRYESLSRKHLNDRWQ
jgi:hypothetical protein